MTAYDVIDFFAYGLLLLVCLYGVLNFGLWLACKIIRKAGLWGDLIGFMASKYKNRRETP